jgi:tRNA pseudouridine55 synthase
LLNLNKPPGLTSRQAVNCVQRLARPAKVGHAGTLDPLARGVLVVCVGSATRLIEYVQRMPKSYAASFLLGRESPTEDVDGEVTELVDPPIPSLDELSRAAESLTGTIQQRPPAFSALKVAGRRAYDMARAGRQVQLQPRPVTVYRMTIVGYEYPELKLEIDCGSGTYVRSLGRDLARSLGTAAVMSALVRTAIGDFRVEEAIEPDALNAENWRGHLRPPLDAVASLPRIELTAEQVVQIRSGQFIADPLGTGRGSEEVAAANSAGGLVAILTRRGSGLLGPSRNFPADA